MIPSRERGCGTKARLSRTRYASDAFRMSRKHGKQYGVYLCPYCQYPHLTTKLENRGNYSTPLLYITPQPIASMTLQEIDEQLRIKKAAVSEIMVEVHDTPPKSLRRRELTQQHLEISREIQDLKAQKAQLASALTKMGKGALRVAALHHVAENRVSYYACELTNIELLLQLDEIYGEEKPAITNIMAIPEEDRERIPAGWFELE